MSTCPLPTRHDYWVKSSDPFTPSLFVGEFMTENYFNRILGVFSLPTYNKPDDPHNLVRRFLDAVNERWRKVFIPGIRIVIDESMVPWKGLGMPGFMFVPRKPHPFGAELKTACCCATGIMCGFELQEGKDHMKKKPYYTQYGAGTSCVLRLVHCFKHSARVIIADSSPGRYLHG